MKRIRNFSYNAAGFSLPELLIAISILALIIVAFFRIFIYCAVLSDLSRNLTLALGEADSKIEEIRNHAYNDIVTDYSSGGTPGDTFDTTTCTGKGAIYIDSSNSDLLEIKVTVSWQNRDGRIVGEDVDLDGELDTGEDLDGNGELDSPATVASMVSRR